MKIADPKALLSTLCAQARETEWLEFKQDYFEADEAGRYVSALANSAMLKDQPHGYLVYGVENAAHRKIGTKVRLKSEKVGNEVLEHWLTRSLDPRINLEFVAFEDDGRHFEIIAIDPAYQHPIRFKGEAYIRIDSITKPLREYPQREKALWLKCSKTSFEDGVCADHLNRREIFDRFYCAELLAALGKPHKSSDGMIAHLVSERLLLDDKQGGFDATNLLALVAAKDLSMFPQIKRKTARVIQYKGKNKLVAISEDSGNLGFAVSFTRLLKYIMARIPQNEEMRHGVRVTEHVHPELAVREFLANALIHQDLSSTGDSPLVEIYSDKLEISNPGTPLVPTDRFIDAPPRSRNERLAAIMRRLRFCEERGSGVDRALDAIEQQSLAPPLFREVANSTVVTLYGEKTFAAMRKEDRLRACYQHAVLRFIANDPMSNGSLRRRFNLADAQYPQISIVIKDATDGGLIKPLAEDQANRNARYVPSWA